MKKRLLCVVLILCLACTIVFAACNNTDKDAEEALAALTLEQDGQAMTTAFTLPEKAGDYAITWTANPSASLTINGTTATPVRSESNVTVTLTATIKGKNNDYSKSFTIIVPKAEAVAPSPEQTALNGYIFLQNGTQVTAEFTLPAKIGGYDVTWTASPAESLTITARAGQDYLATPVRTESTARVTLTVKIGTVASRNDYWVTVPALDVNAIRNSYTFAWNNATVTADFNLDESHTYLGKTATIDWSVASGSEDYIKVENGKCVLLVDNITDVHNVTLNAVFKMGTATANAAYSFKVAKLEDHYVAMHKFYQQGGGSSNINFEGYVVAMGQNYNNGANVALYLVDVDGCHGLYAYQTKADSAIIPDLKAGAHVLVTGGTIDVYNGGIQLKSGTVSLLDTNKDSVDSLIYAIDEDLLGDLPATVYRTASLVSVSNWEVESKKTAPAEGGSTYSGTLITLKKGSVKVNVAFSNYMEECYISAPQTDKKYTPDDKCKALVSKLLSAEVGDYVSVKGILSNYNGWQILPRSADDVTIVKAADSEGIDKTVSTKGTSAKAAITALEAQLEEQIKGTVVVNTNVTLPMTSNGATIRYRISDVASVSSATLTHSDTESEGATLALTPGADAETLWVEATITVDGFTTTYYFSVTTQKLSDAEIVKVVLANIDSELKTSFDDPAEIALPTECDFDGVTIVWTVKDTEKTWLKIENNKLIVSAPEQDDQGKITVTVTLNESTNSKDVTISAKAVDMNVITLTVVTMGLKDQSYSDKTTAAVTTVRGLEISYIGLGNYGNGIQMNSSYNSRLYTANGVSTGKVIEKIEFNYNSGKTPTAGELLTVSFGVDNKCEQETQKVVATSDLAYTITPAGNWNYVDIKYSAPKNAQYWDSIIIYLKDGQPDSATSPAVVLKKVLTELQDELKTDFLAPENYTLPTTEEDGVNVEWLLVNEQGETTTVEWLVVEDGVLKVTTPTETAQATLRIKVSMGESEDHKDVTITYTVVDEGKYGSLETPLTVAQAIALGTPLANNELTPVKIYVKGYVVKSVQGPSSGEYNFYISDTKGDESKTVQIYWAAYDQAIYINDEVVVCGYLTKYNTTIETTKKDKVSGTNNVVSLTRGTSTITLGAHEGATVTGFEDNSATATNGTTFSFTVSADADKDIVMVQEGSTTLKSESNTYSFTVAGDTTVTVQTAAKGEKVLRTLELDFSKKTWMDQIGSSESSTIKDLVIDSITYKFKNCKQTSTYAYIMFSKSGAAFLANETALPGNIVKIEVTVPKGSSGSAKYYVSLHTTAQLDTLSSGTPTTGNNSQDTLITVTASEEDGCSYFNISTTTAANGQVSKIVIYYYDK